MKKSRYYVVDKYGNVTREMLYGATFNCGGSGLSRGYYYCYCKPIIYIRHDEYTGAIEPWIYNNMLVIKAEYVFKSKKEAYQYLHDKLKKGREAIDEKIALVEKKLANLALV